MQSGFSGQLTTHSLVRVVEVDQAGDKVLLAVGQASEWVPVGSLAAVHETIDVSPDGDWRRDRGSLEVMDPVAAGVP